MAYNLIFPLKKEICMKKVFVYLLATALVSAITAFAVVKLTDTKNRHFNERESNVPIHNVTLSDQLYPDFTFAAETAVKAVVHVKVTKKGNEQPFTIYDFFFGYGNPGMAPRSQINSGSGVIITSDGYIITNNHVIDGADEILVTLDDNKSYNAKLIGKDPVTDIALLKINEDNLPYLSFGNSDSLRLGEWVIAIGNPYNLRSTITAGIVSAKARSMPDGGEDFKIESFIQTDAAVNPGNSGGALVNTKGELVGINTAIASRTGSYTGYSFAVPSSIAKKVVEDLIDFGVVQRALLGISMQDIDGELAKEKGLSSTSGVFIAEVVRGGAAEKAGVKEGDVLTAINGVKVNSGPAVQEQISKFRPKDKVDLTLKRDTKQISLSVVLQSKSGSDGAISDSNDGLYNLFGAQLKTANPEKLKKLSLKNGVEIVSVSGGKFKATGIKSGFIITYVNQTPVYKPSDIELIAQSSRRSLLIEGVYPDGSVVYYGMGL